jgi:hypothetical protein
LSPVKETDKINPMIALNERIFVARADDLIAVPENAIKQGARAFFAAIQSAKVLIKLLEVYFRLTVLSSLDLTLKKQTQ